MGQQRNSHSFSASVGLLQTDLQRTMASSLSQTVTAYETYRDAQAHLDRVAETLTGSERLAALEKAGECLARASEVWSKCKRYLIAGTSLSLHPTQTDLLSPPELPGMKKVATIVVTVESGVCKFLSLDLTSKDVESSLHTRSGNPDGPTKKRFLGPYSDGLAWMLLTGWVEADIAPMLSSCTNLTRESESRRKKSTRSSLL